MNERIKVQYSGKLLCKRKCICVMTRRMPWLERSMHGVTQHGHAWLCVPCVGEGAKSLETRSRLLPYIALSFRPS